MATTKENVQFMCQDKSYFGDLSLYLISAVLNSLLDTHASNRAVALELPNVTNMVDTNSKQKEIYELK